MTTSYQERLERIEGYRQKSIKDKDNIAYATYCLELGVEPEYPDRFYSGMLESQKNPQRKRNLEYYIDKIVRDDYKDKKQEGPKKSNELNGYQKNFLKEAMKLDQRIDKEMREKTLLMMKYFKKFKSEGSDYLFSDKYKNDADEIDPCKIGRKFKNIVEGYYKKDYYAKALAKTK